MLTKLIKNFPNLKFQSASNFVWSPAKQTIFYDPKQLAQPLGAMALLHEVSHASLDHHTYQYDIDLLNMEIEAWTLAKQLAPNYGVIVDEDHIESCLETYRTWLFKRSRCPNCSGTSMQANSRTYRCFSCGASWRVAPTLTLQPQRRGCSLPI